jgi:HAE1 family hydrophobic/amphiphilic exporter-1
MSLPHFAVRRPVTTTMLVVAMVVMGVAAFVLLRVDMLPEIEPPAISVATLYPGATALDIESEVTELLEDQFSSLNNLDTLSSVSKDNISLITLKYDWNVNLDEAANDIRDKVSLTRRDLPDDAEDPLIFKFNSSDFPVMIATVSARESYRDLHRIVDKQIVDPLRRVAGVGEVMIRGGMVRQIRVTIDREQLEQLNIPVQRVEQALANENINMPAGELKRGFSELKLRVPGRFRNVADIKSVVLGVYKGGLITLKDVATVEDDFQEPTEMVWGNGERAVVLIIRKQSGQNTVEVCKRVRAALQRFQERMPRDVSINVLIDNSDPIVTSLANLRGSLITGGILVVIVTWVFLLRLRSSMIIAVTIPVSLISVFTVMYVCGYTLNIISLCSLTIAVGMVVDNAIVVLESVTRHLHHTGDPMGAAVAGAQEVALAISGSTLTTIVVFLPLLFTTGITGILFKQLAVVVTTTLVVSWFVAVTLTPMMASRLLPREHDLVGRRKAVADKIMGAYTALENAYARLLALALRHRVSTVAIAAAFFVGTLYFARFIGSEFMPNSDTGDLNVTIEYDENTRLDETARTHAALSAFLVSNIPERIGTYMVAGESREGFASAAGQREGPNIMRGGAKLISPELRKRSAVEIADTVRRFAVTLPGVKRVSVSALSFVQRIFLSSGSGKPISVEVQGPDLDELERVAQQVHDLLTNVAGAVDVTIVKPEYRKELWVDVDRVRAAALGVTIAELSKSVRSFFYGNEATEFRDAGDNFEVFVRLPLRQRARVEDILNISVPSAVPDAPLVKLSNVARVVEREGPLEVQRKNRERICRVEAEVLGRATGQVVADMRTALADLDLPPGVTVEFGGDAEEQAKAFRSLLALLCLGVALVYMVMAAQFESYKDPFVVMFSVPFAFTGAVWFLFLTGNRLNVMSFIGVIMLMGIVVNNAIVLIDYMQQLRRQGKALEEAITIAGATRLRPVLMTTITTVVGMLPMAFSRMEGSEGWRPLGATVIGGLLISTLVTLVLVPVVYAMFERNGSAKVSISH